MAANIDILTNLFGFWPLLFLAILEGFIHKRNQIYAALKYSLRIMIILWVCFALIRAYAFSLDYQVKTYIFQDPLNTGIFFFTGFLLFGLQLLVIFVYKEHEGVGIYNVYSVEGLKKIPAGDLLSQIAAYFRHLGHNAKIILPEENSTTGGVLVKTKLKKKWVVQLIHTNHKAGDEELCELIDAITRNDADLGVLISTCGVIPGLLEMAKYQPVKLLDGSHLLKMFYRLRVMRMQVWSDSTLSDKTKEKLNKKEKEKSSKPSLSTYTN